MWRRNRRALALIASIMLIVFASILVVGVTQFIIQKEQQSATRRTTLNLIDNAHAGLHYAIYNYRWRSLSAAGGFFTGQFSIDTDNKFVINGTDADLLMVRPTNPPVVIAGTGGNLNKELQSVTIQNANRTSTITIASMTVTWTGFGGNITVVRINGSNQWTGTSPSGTNLNITDFALNTTPTVYTINYLRFDTVIPAAGSTIDVTFTMTDNSTRTARFWPTSNVDSMTVSAMGCFQTCNTGGAGDHTLYRTLEADYNTLTGKMTRWAETSDIIVP